MEQLQQAEEAARMTKAVQQGPSSSRVHSTVAWLYPSYPQCWGERCYCDSKVIAADIEAFMTLTHTHTRADAHTQPSPIPCKIQQIHRQHLGSSHLATKQNVSHTHTHTHTHRHVGSSRLATKENVSHTHTHVQTRGLKQFWGYKTKRVHQLYIPIWTYTCLPSLALPCPPCLPCLPGAAPALPALRPALRLPCLPCLFCPALPCLPCTTLPALPSLPCPLPRLPCLALPCLPCLLCPAWWHSPALPALPERLGNDFLKIRNSQTSDRSVCVCVCVYASVRPRRGGGGGRGRATCGSHPRGRPYARRRLGLRHLQAVALHLGSLSLSLSPCPALHARACPALPCLPSSISDISISHMYRSISLYVYIYTHMYIYTHISISHV